MTRKVVYQFHTKAYNISYAKRKLFIEEILN